jgi:hypothetical protein
MKWSKPTYNLNQTLLSTEGKIVEFFDRTVAESYIILNELTSATILRVQQLNTEIYYITKKYKGWYKI